MYSFPCVCVSVCVCEREREREKVGGERRSSVVCHTGNEKSLLSLIERALFMISKAEELKCLSSTLFFVCLVF